MDPIFGAIQQNLDSALSVPFVSSSVLLGLAFYAYKAAPELPSFMEDLFNHVFFQIFVGFMVLYMSTQNFMLSLVVSIVFVYGVYLFAKVKENLSNDKKPYSKFKEFMERGEFQKKLIENIEDQGITLTNVSEDQKKKIGIETIVNNGYYTPENLGYWIYQDNNDIETHVNEVIYNAKNASSVLKNNLKF